MLLKYRATLLCPQPPAFVGDDITWNRLRHTRWNSVTVAQCVRMAQMACCICLVCSRCTSALPVMRCCKPSRTFCHMWKNHQLECCGEKHACVPFPQHQTSQHALAVQLGLKWNAPKVASLAEVQSLAGTPRSFAVRHHKQHGDEVRSPSSQLLIVGGRGFTIGLRQERWRLRQVSRNQGWQAYAGFAARMQR